MKPAKIDARALSHMRACLAAGWGARSMMIDYADAALQAEGYPADVALAAAEKCFAAHFEITEPN
jgi:hypothetical protein